MRYMRGNGIDAAAGVAVPADRYPHSIAAQSNRAVDLIDQRLLLIDFYD